MRTSPEARSALGAFGQTVRAVEAAKAALVSAVPGRRGPGTALAEALAGFEGGLREAESSMDAWQDAASEEEWSACRAGIEEALRRAESLRLEGSPQGYEELAGVLADLMEPLHTFEAAARSFHDRGTSG